MSEKDFMGHRLMERRLEEELPAEAELFEALGGRELHLDEVMTRAGGIQRKRRTLTGLVAAAAVVALVVPAGVILADRDSAGGPAPLSHPTTSTSTSPSPSPTPTTDPNAVHTISRAELGGEPGPIPAEGYVENGVWHDPDGSAWRVPGDTASLLAIAPVGNSLLLATADDLGRPTIELVARRGDVIESWPSDGGSGFARSADGRVAFVLPDGRPVVVEADGTSWVALHVRVPRGSGFQAVALLGGACTAEPQGPGCTVVVNSRGVHPEAWLLNNRGTVEPVGAGVISVDAAAADGRLAAMTSVDETTPGSCSEILSPRQEKLWDTCDNRFIAFSPSGTELLASGPYADGFGDGVLDVLDAETGDPIAHYRTADGLAITATQWEDDAHVLAIVSDQAQWAVVRLGLDGQVQVAVPPVRGETASLVLPTR